MRIQTTRFGTLEVLEQDIIDFAHGMIGMETCRKWVLLADAVTPALGWLQSTERPELALAVVSPRRFVPDYQVRVSNREVASLGLESNRSAQVLAVVSKTPQGLTLNLKAPLVISIDQRAGKQVIAKNDHAVQYSLGATIPFRRSA